MAEGDGSIRTTHRHVVTVADLVRGHPAGGGHAREVLKDAAKENGHVVEIIEGKEISALSSCNFFLSKLLLLFQIIGIKVWVLIIYTTRIILT